MSSELITLSNTLAYRHAVQMIEAGCRSYGRRPEREFDLRNHVDRDLRDAIIEAVRYLELRKLIKRNPGELHMVRILENRKDDTHVLS